MLQRFIIFYKCYHNLFTMLVNLSMNSNILYVGFYVNIWLISYSKIQIFNVRLVPSVLKYVK